MARPPKIGVETMPMSVDFFEREEIAAIGGEFGIAGELVAVKLLCAIYRSGGAMEWTERRMFALMRQLPGVSHGTMAAIIERLVQWGMFDAEPYELGILTSEDIRRQYSKMTGRRVSVYRNTSTVGVSVDNNSEAYGVSANSNSEVSGVSANSNSAVPGVSVCKNTPNNVVYACRNSTIMGVSVCNNSNDTDISVCNNPDTGSVSVYNNPTDTGVSVDNNTSLAGVSACNNSEQRGFLYAETPKTCKNAQDSGVSDSPLLPPLPVSPPVPPLYSSPLLSPHGNPPHPPKFAEAEEIGNTPDSAIASKSEPPEIGIDAEKKEKIAPKRKKADLSGFPIEFQGVLAEWLAYKTERGQSYKPRGLQGCFSRLYNLSRGDPERAKQIIDFSIANNYAGLFPPNNYENERSRTTNRPPTDDELARAVAEGLARANTVQPWEM